MMRLFDQSARVYDERTIGGARLGLRKIAVGHADALGVYINIVSTKAFADGWLEVWGFGPQPPSSSLNYRANEDNNMVLWVPVAGDGTIQVYTSSATQIIVDVRGEMTRDNYITAEG